MKKLLLPALAFLSLAAGAVAAEKPLKALLITGGCCHDYAKQKDILKAGIEKRANIEVTLSHSDDKSTKPPLEIYGKPDYAKSYDVVIHDECAADIKDVAVVEGVLKPHVEGTPAVNLHCAMHCYRTGTPMWFEYLGLQSSGHGPQLPIEITHTDSNHPITKGLDNWTTGKEELYNNLKIWDTAKPLAKGKQVVKQKDGTEKEVEAVITWTHEYGPKKTRVFSTTLAHNNETVGDDRYLDLVTRGILWATGKLAEDGKPAAGYGK